jgi:hypothetical protein
MFVADKIQPQMKEDNENIEEESIAPVTFHPFPELPIELQSKIWKILAAQQQQDII